MKNNNIEIDIQDATLDELLFCLGGVIFAGTKLYDIDTNVLERLDDLVKEEIIVRKRSLKKNKELCLVRTSLFRGDHNA